MKSQRELKCILLSRKAGQERLCNVCFQIYGVLEKGTMEIKVHWLPGMKEEGGRNRYSTEDLGSMKLLHMI